MSPGEGQRVEWDVSFVEFVRDQADELYRASYLLVGEPSGAADLVQETLTRLYPKWDRVLGADSALAYVRKAVVNQYLSGARRLRSREVLLADVPDTGVDDEVASRFMDQAVLDRPLATLSPKQRTAVVLRYFHDLSDHESAVVMGCSVPTFRSHLRRGLAALRRQLTTSETPPVDGRNLRSPR